MNRRNPVKRKLTKNDIKLLHCETKKVSRNSQVKNRGYEDNIQA